MRNKFWNKKIPKGLGILALLISFVTIGYLSSNAILFGTRAAIGNTPKDVKASNIKPDSFTISYRTDEKVLGSVRFGTDQNPKSIALDDRDQETNAPKERNIHYITINKLSPATRYWFEIVSGDKTFKNGETLFVIDTAVQNAETLENEQTISGKVTMSDGNPPTDGIVYVSTEDSQIISSTLSTDGSYLITTDMFLKKNLKDSVEINPNTQLNISIVSFDSSSSISVPAGQANHIPLITLSKNYDFSAGATEDSQASDSAEISPFPENEDEPFTEPVITKPRDGEELKDAQPLISGKSLPGTEAEIILRNNEKELATIESSDDIGSWHYRPDSPLDPGSWELIVNAFDANGNLKSLNRSFTILAEGSQFIEPSVSPTSSTTPIPTPTVEPLPTESITPTNLPTPTINITTPTPTPELISLSPTVPSSIITQPPIPISGDGTSFLGAIGIITFITLGGILFFLF